MKRPQEKGKYGKTQYHLPKGRNNCCVMEFMGISLTIEIVHLVSNYYQWLDWKHAHSISIEIWIVEVAIFGENLHLASKRLNSQGKLHFLLRSNRYMPYALSKLTIVFVNVPLRGPTVWETDKEMCVIDIPSRRAQRETGIGRKTKSVLCANLPL